MKRFAMLFAIIALLVGMAVAQNGAFAPYVDGSIGFTGTGSTFSTSNPDYQIGGGLESSSKHLLLDVNGQFNSTNLSNLGGVLKNTGGYTSTVQGSAYYKLAGHFLVGGGAFYSNQVLSGTTAYGSYKASFNVNQIRPFVSGGVQFSRDRLLVDYILPGRNDVNGLGNILEGIPAQNDKTVRFRNEIFTGKTGLRKHIRLTQEVDVTSSNSAYISLSTLRTDTIKASGGVKFVF